MAKKKKSCPTSFFPSLAVLGIALIAAFPTRAAEGRPGEAIPESYFGMHLHSKPGYERAFSETRFARLRTWDAGIVWPTIEPEKGVWKWELLDDYVRLARENGAALVFTLGMTPYWAAGESPAPSPYHDCSSSPPADREDWKRFVSMLAVRNEAKYGGAIRHWEVWNEPDNIHGNYQFYSGSPEELVELAREARDILKAANPENKMAAPGVTQTGDGWLDRYFAAGGKDLTDVTAFHFYWDWHSPRWTDFEAVAAKFKRVFEKNGLENKPFWVSETGFGLDHYKSEAEKLRALVQTTLAPWLHGADAAFLYAWNNSMFTGFFDNDTREVTDRLMAYNALHGWLAGSEAERCELNDGKIRICALKRREGVARIFWKEGRGREKFPVPSGWGDGYFDLEGNRKRLPENRLIPVGAAPALIASPGFFTEETR